MNFSKLKIIGIIFPVFISLAILSLLLWKIDPAAIWSVLRQSDLRFILSAALVSLASNIGIGALKWRRILSALDCRLPLAEVLAVRTGCIPFKILLPLKSSELLKAYYLHRRGKLDFLTATSSLVIDKVLNLPVVFLIFFIGLFWIDLPIPRILPLIACTVVLLFIFVPGARKFLLFFTKVNHRVEKFTSGLVGSFDLIPAREKAILLTYSIIYQLSEFVNTWLLFKAVGITLPLPMVMVGVPCIMIVNNLPMGVMGIGTRESMLLLLFNRVTDLSIILSGGILVSLVEDILPVTIGLLFVRAFYGCYVRLDLPGIDAGQETKTPLV